MIAAKWFKLGNSPHYIWSTNKPACDKDALITYMSICIEIQPK